MDAPGAGPPQNFWARTATGYTLDPFLQRVEGMREGESWEMRVKEERGIYSPNKTLEKALDRSISE